MEEAIIRFVNTELLAPGSPSVSATDEIVLDGTVDSLGVTRLVDFIQRELAVAIPAEDITIENFRSIEALAAYVRSRRDVEPAR
jgi:acyl carrier protein